MSLCRPFIALKIMENNEGRTSCCHNWFNKWLNTVMGHSLYVPTTTYVYLRTYTYVPIPTYLYLRAYTYEPIPTYLYPRTYTQVHIPTYLYPRTYSYLPSNEMVCPSVGKWRKNAKVVRLTFRRCNIGKNSVKFCHFGKMLSGLGIFRVSKYLAKCPTLGINSVL